MIDWWAHLTFSQALLTEFAVLSPLAVTLWALIGLVRRPPRRRRPWKDINYTRHDPRDSLSRFRNETGYTQRRFTHEHQSGHRSNVGVRSAHADRVRR